MFRISLCGFRIWAKRGVWMAPLNRAAASLDKALRCQDFVRAGIPAKNRPKGLEGLIKSFEFGVWSLELKLATGN